MKLHILGSRSGTEPFPKRRHTSYVLELSNGNLYWFDAGEGCSHTAYLMGLDFLKIRSIFISHSHYDHLCGLFNIFAVHNKICFMLEPERNRGGSFDLYLPDGGLREPIELLARKICAWPAAVEVNSALMRHGEAFSNEEIKVEFLGNEHIAKSVDGEYRSFSFRITAEGKSIVSSGDCKSPAEFLNWSRDCDLLLMESGHHHPWEVCEYWKENECRIGKILFIHHGRDFLNHPVECKERCQQVWEKELLFADDGMTLEL